MGKVSSMKSFYFRAVLLFLTAVWLGACASTEEVSDGSTWKTSSGASVPGEKTGEEGMAATAGPGSAAAGVRW
jgi:hypothetical protein